MEPHPVPQNVTQFEFHLVGDMTLKQFSYLAAGLVIAYIIFFLIGTQVPVLAWPIILVSALTGIAFAFLPIKERPLDHWFGAFFRAIFKPTQFIYKSEVVVKEDPFYKKRLQFYLNQMSVQPFAQLVWGSTPQIQIPSVKDVLPEPRIQSQQVPKSSEYEPVKSEDKKEPTKEKLPTNEELMETLGLAKEAQLIQNKILETQEELDTVKESAAVPGVNPKDFKKDFEAILNNLQLLNQKAAQISRQIRGGEPLPIPPKPKANAIAKIIPSINLTSTANIINGVVMDAVGNYLDNAIIVAHDKEGVPVRALKSNKLGQFVAATPLSSGVYTLTIEKEALVFDVIQIELEGEVLKPILITAKKTY